MWLSSLDLCTHRCAHRCASIGQSRPCSIRAATRPSASGCAMDCNATRRSAKPASVTERVGLPHLRRDLALSLPHLRRDWALSLPHLRRDWAYPCHITNATSAPGLDSRVSAITATHRPMCCTAAALSAVLTEAQRMPDLPETRAEPWCAWHRVCCIVCVASCVLHRVRSIVQHRACCIVCVNIKYVASCVLHVACCVLENA
jgi:hypothetical protein